MENFPRQNSVDMFGIDGSCNDGVVYKVAREDAVFGLYAAAPYDGVADDAEVSGGAGRCRERLVGDLPGLDKIFVQTLYRRT